MIALFAPRPTNKAMTDNRASSVNSDPCPHFMWSEVGHLSDKAFIVMPRQKPQNALWAFWDICRGSLPPRPPSAGGLNLNRTHRVKVPLLLKKMYDMYDKRQIRENPYIYIYLYNFPIFLIKIHK